MEKDLSLILLIFAGVILLLLFIYSFRTRVSSTTEKVSELNEFDKANEDEADILTKSVKKNERTSTIDYDNEFEDLIIKSSIDPSKNNNFSAESSINNNIDEIDDIDNSTTHIEPKLNKFVLEDDTLIIRPTLKRNVENITLSSFQDKSPKINPQIIKNSIHTHSSRVTPVIRKEPISAKIKPPLKFPVIEDPQTLTTEVSPPLPPTSLLVLHVMPQEEQKFVGYELLQALLAAKLRFGKMSIFHCHENINIEGKILFSVAQVTEPGTFNMNEMGACQCTGLVLFMQLIGPEHNLQIMDKFIQTAQQLADSLNGVLMEKRGMAFTAEAKKHFITSVQHHLDKLSVVA